MKTYTLTYDNKVILKTKSYAKLYKNLLSHLYGGLAFGMDLNTLNALGYKITIK